MRRMRRKGIHLRISSHRTLCSWLPVKVPKDVKESGFEGDLEEYFQMRTTDNEEDVTCGNCRNTLKRTQFRKEGKLPPAMYGGTRHE